ncbi:MAG TPA: nucleotidyl transferase AbiEii/AbiGii toxin family protein [Longimicrobiales bacterium]|nr:nucleotidyl transferase AbiEii/AbiGii toxin family protein [Longimicrobiales bacterium]
MVSPLHVRILGAISRSEEAYGALDLRLEGGTALAAYYVGHRQSEDLDLFGGPALDARDFRSFVEDRLPAEGLHVLGGGPASRGFAELLLGDDSMGEPGTPHAVVRVQFGRASPFRLEPPLATAEGPPVASYRDVCAGKLHALCDRFEPRDFIDLHCILGRRREGSGPVGESERRSRFRALVADLEECDPGLAAPQVGQALARGLDRPVLGAFPLRMLATVQEAEIQETIRLGLEECARLTRARAAWEGPAG